MPNRHSGLIISNTNSVDLPVPVKHSSKAVHLNNVKFVDGEFSSVRAGFPLDFDSDTCVQCLKDSPDGRIIASNCTVSAGPTFPAGSLSIDIEISSSRYAKLCFSEVSRPRSILGKSDSTYNGSHGAIFMVQGNIREMDNSSEILYLEYANQAHFQQIGSEIAEKVVEGDQNFELSFPIKNTIQGQIIHCVRNELHMEAFRGAIQVYRTMQLESVFKPFPFQDNFNCFDSIKVFDVYRAILTFKLAEGTEIEGDYLVYSQCAVYNPKFLIPFTVSSLFLVILLAVAYFQHKKNSTSNEMRDFNIIPHSSEGWFRYLCQGNNQNCTKLKGKLSTSVKSIRLGSEEMFLVGEDDNLHVEWSSNGERYSGMAVSTEVAAAGNISVEKVISGGHFEESTVESTSEN